MCSQWTVKCGRVVKATTVSAAVAAIGLPNKAGCTGGRLPAGPKQIATRLGPSRTGEGEGEGEGGAVPPPGT